ncbi:amino acid ABC transporter permease, partial [Citrobacter freundii]
SLIQHLVERTLARSERRSAINTVRVSRAEKRSRQRPQQEAVHVPLA